MGPRKRSKPNPKAEAEVKLPVQSAAFEPESQVLQEHEAETATRDRRPSTAESASDPDKGTKAPTKTWYSGTWSRGTKAASVNQVVKESISVSGGAASEFLARAHPDTPDGSSKVSKNATPYISRNMGSSSRSLPLAAKTTKLNITSNASSIPNYSPSGDAACKSDDAASKMQSTKLIPVPDKSVKEDDTKLSRKEQTAPQNGLKIIDSVVSPVLEIGTENNTYGWLGWFSKSSQPYVREPKLGQDSQGHGQATHNATKYSLGNDPGLSQHEEADKDQRRSSDPNPVAAATQREEQSRSWLNLWSNANVPSGNIVANIASKSPNGTPSEETPLAANAEPRNDQPLRSWHPTTQSSSHAIETSKSPGWSFWSKDRFKDGPTPLDSKDDIAKLALARSSLQAHPENVIVNRVEGTPSKLSKREGLHFLEGHIDANSPETSVRDFEQRGNNKKTISKTRLNDQALASIQRTPTNLLLPSFKRTYRIAEQPSIFRHLSRLWQYGQLPDTRHLDIVPNPPHIRSALAIGVHGYFPAPLIRSVLGQPTGTSIRFANGAANAIQRWTKHHGYSCEIEKVALEGEGKIAERIDLLWKLMLNWIENIRKADFVMIACHSQGVPVAISLVAKLITFGCVNAAKIGICAMAGVNLGPFVDYKSRWIGGSAGELFDFARPESQVSRDYEAALGAALKFGVKIVYIGSIDDQLVSLESSTFGTAIHPYIYRAVFVDGRVHAPDFLTHLVGFALKLRNLGISDHGLIRELSSPLAGSLYGGEGHSRIYDDDAVYYLAVEHALETSSVGMTPLKVQRDSTANSQNPYILPFAIRGLLEEEYVRTELANETAELLRQFDEWKPSSKVLKDVKFRLEGVRSKL